MHRRVRSFTSIVRSICVVALGSLALYLVVIGTVAGGAPQGGHHHLIPLAATVPAAPTLSRTGWTATASSQETAGRGDAPANVLDGDAGTSWQSRYSGSTSALPASITVDLHTVQAVSGLVYTPRRGSPDGRIGQYRVEVSLDGSTWGTPVTTGTWADDATVKTASFDTAGTRFVRLTALTEAGSGRGSGAAELNLLGAPTIATAKVATASVVTPNAATPSAATANAATPNAATPKVAAAVDPSKVGSWGPMIGFPLVPTAAALLPNNRVLLWSANYTDNYSLNGGQTQTAILDLSTNVVSQRLITNTHHEMFCPGVAILADGRVMVTGGADSQKTSIYDPATDSWSAGPDLNIPRGYNGQTLLPSGEVFTIGGSWNTAGVGGKSGEVWSQAGGWRTLSGVPADPIYTADPKGPFRADNHAWLFPVSGGRLLHAGPSKQLNWITTTGAGTITPAGTRADSADAMNGNAVYYDTDRIFTAGGSPAYDDSDATNRSYTIDLRGAQPAVKRTGDLATARAFANSVVLPNGQVLVVGGQSHAVAFSDDTSALTGELWDPASGAFTTTAAMAVPRNYHSWALLLPDGRVLSGGVGLCGTGCATNHPDAQIFTPGYLLNPDGTTKARPTLTSSPAAAAAGSTITVGADSAVSQFSLLRYGEATHSVDNDQRRVPLQIASSTGTSYQLALPADSGVLLPGPYMLYGLNSAGVPSLSRPIMIGAQATVTTPPTTTPPTTTPPTTTPPTTTTPVTTSLPVTNPGFEDPVLADGAIGSASPPGWTGTGASYNPSSYWYSGLTPTVATTGTMSGPNALYFWSGAGTSTQTTTTKVTAGTTYTLTVAVGGRSANETLGGAVIGLQAGGTTVATKTIAAPPAPGSFGDVSVTWTAGTTDAGKALGISLGMATGGSTNYADYDNVRLTATAPVATTAPPVTTTAPPVATPTPPVTTTAPPVVTSALPVTDPAFEDPALADGAISAALPAGWTGNGYLYNPSSVWYAGLSPTVATIGTMFGPNSLFFWSAAATATQTTTTKVTAGTTYALTVAVGGRSANGTLGGAVIGLQAGGTTVASKTISAPPVAGSFGDLSVNWTAGAADAGKTLAITLGMANSGSSNYVDYDNVRLTATPASAATTPTSTPTTPPSTSPSAPTASVTNGSFDAETIGAGAVVPGTPSGWEGGQSAYRPTSAYYTKLATATAIGTMNGPNVLFMYQAPGVPVAQTTPTIAAGGVTYTLTVAVGGRDTNGAVFGGSMISLLAGGTVVATKVTAAAPAPGSFGDVTLTWTAGAADGGKAVGISLSQVNGGSNTYVDYDNVRLTASGTPTVPSSLVVASPVSRQVIQRGSTGTADVTVRGVAPAGDVVQAQLVVRTGQRGTSTGWVSLPSIAGGGQFSGKLPTVAGGWYDLTVRELTGGAVTSSQSVQRIGVGEIFVTAGQSNSSNWGNPTQQPADDRVSAPTLALGAWQAAADPQPNADGTGGSAWPAFGDAFAAGTGLPVGIIAVGYGGTSATQWQPGGMLYARLQTAIKELGPNGFRAVLWHQGEADGQNCTTTADYSTLLKNIITASRADAGFTVPWGIATASTLPGNTAACMSQVTTAQAQIVQTTTATFAGPNTDSYRANGWTWDTIHFNATGLQNHGKGWYTAVQAWGGVPS